MSELTSRGARDQPVAINSTWLLLRSFGRAVIPDADVATTANSLARNGSPMLGDVES
ncbi:hypothetical protein SH528x_005716 [Novipirellula sp. SH528]|uniref:hypothetical protein n=1 Tax=Novipirellula sp. SH528 TaxID=3454466 RepID=UPI003FA0B23F